MKITNYLIIGVAAALVSVVACKKKDKTTAKPTGVVLAKVNGTSWEGASSGTINIDGNNYYMNYASLSGDTLTISAIHKSGDTSGIYFYDIKLKAGSVGTVSGTTNAYSGGMYMKRYDLNNLLAALGDYNVVYELTVSKKDATAKTISGTFTISMTPKTSGLPSYSITEGEFIDLKYK